MGLISGSLIWALSIASGLPGTLDKWEKKKVPKFTAPARGSWALEIWDNKDYNKNRLNRSMIYIGS